MAKQDVTVELFYNGVWNAVAAYTSSPIRITCGRDEGAEPTPKSATLALAGFHNPKSPRSEFYGLAGQNTPMRVKVGSTVRCFGEIASWDPHRTVDHNTTTGRGKAWTNISAGGVLRRIGQGTDPLGSAMFRTMSGITANDYVPLAYWPMQDGRDATLLGAHTSGILPATISGDVTPATYTGAAGSAAVPVLNAGGTISGTFPATTLVANVAGDTGWHVEFMAMVPSTLSADANFLDINVPPNGGSNVTMLRVVWQHSSSRLQLRWYNAAFTVVGFAELDLTGLRDIPALFSISLTTDVSGSPGDVNANFSMWTDSSGFASAFDFGSWTAPAVPVPTTWRAYGSAGNAGWSFSHFALYTDPLAVAGGTVQGNARALDGHAGETAADRFTRLCQEEGILNSVVGDAADTQPMGPQPQETLAALFTELERTDDGIIFESVTSAALRYRTRRDLYNQDPALVLDYADNEVAPPLDLILDDRSSRNDVTVKRRDGGEARAVLETGSLSVQEPPDGIGRYATKVDVNTETDDVLAHHAYWHLSKGTVNGARYAFVTVDLDAKPSLVPDMNLIPGDIIALDNLPADEATGRVRLMMIGYTETIGSHRRLITFTCVPATPYDVGTYGPDASIDVVPLYGAGETSLAVSVDETETTWLVDPRADPWPTTASHPSLFPVDISLGGLSYECNSIEVAATDTFGRTVADSWGTADSGQTYTLVGGTAPNDYDVTGGFGEHSLTSVNVFRHSLLDLGSSDQDITVDTEINVSTPTGGSAQSWVAARLTDTSNYYVAILSVTTAGLVDLNLYRRVAGTLTQLIPAPVVLGSGHSAGDFWSIRLRVIGSRLLVKAWRSTNPEPGIWHGDATDTALTTGSQIGLISRLDAGNSNALPVTVSWTNLRSAAPLVFDVTRVPDDKAHTAGDQITVTDTPVYTL